MLFCRHPNPPSTTPVAHLNAGLALPYSCACIFLCRASTCHMRNVSTHNTIYSDRIRDAVAMAKWHRVISFLFFSFCVSRVLYAISGFASCETHPAVMVTSKEIAMAMTTTGGGTQIVARNSKQEWWRNRSTSIRFCRVFLAVWAWTSVRLGLVCLEDVSLELVCTEETL